MAITIETALENAGNPMQRLMFEWAKTAPYNALHIVDIQGEFDHNAWQSAMNSVIANLHYPLLKSIQKPLQPIELVTGNLVDKIHQELNRPFALDDYPIRGFMLPLAEGRYYFGITYSHWVADSIAMRLFMKNLLLTLNHQSDHVPKVDPPPPHFLQHYRRYLGALCSGLLWVSALKHALFYKGAFRTPMGRLTDYSCAYYTVQLPRALLTTLRYATKQAGVALNDVFIASLSAVLGEFWAQHRQNFPDGPVRRGRNRIAIGTIADIRTPDLHKTFGQYLGSYTVITADPERTDSKQLLQEVSKQTRRMKSKHQDKRSLRVWCTALQCWLRDHRPEKKARFFIKTSPIMAGISNVNLDACEHTQALTAMSGEIQPMAYWRVSPTGPLLPLVFTLTTYQGELTLGVTYRKIAYSADDVNRLVGSFIASLHDYGSRAERQEERQDVVVT